MQNFLALSKNSPETKGAQSSPAIDHALHHYMCDCIFLQIALTGISQIVSGQCLVDVDQMGVVALDQVSVERFIERTRSLTLARRAGLRQPVTVLASGSV